MKIIMALAISLVVSMWACDSAEPTDNSRLLAPSRFSRLPDYGYTRPASSQEEPRRWFIVKFHDSSNDNDFVVVDSFPTGQAPPPVPCGPSGVAHVYERGDYYILWSIDLRGEQRRDSVLAFLGHTESTVLTNFWYSSRDSILIFSMMTQFDRESPSKTVVTRLAAGGKLDTVVTLANAIDFVVSRDESELYLKTLRPRPGSSRGQSGIGLYDLASDTLLFMSSRLNFATNAYRMNREMPLYFVQADSAHGMNIWSWAASEGVTQETFHEIPERVGAFRLTVDTLYYELLLLDVDNTFKFMETRGLPVREL